MNAHEILEAAGGHMRDRAKTYDKPGGERSMSATVAAFNAVTGDGMMNTEERGWLFMQLLKCVRSQQGEFRADSYEDGAAYAALAGEAGWRERVSSPDTVVGDAAGIEHQAYHALCATAPAEALYEVAAQRQNDAHNPDDMTDCRNWKAGDLVEFVGERTTGLQRGGVYGMSGVDQDNEYVYLMTGHTVSASSCRWHSRPTE